MCVRCHDKTWKMKCDDAKNRKQKRGSESELMTAFVKDIVKLLGASF